MATNYKKLKWGTNTPDIVKWNTATPSYPGLVKWGNDVVFARAADISNETKSYIASISLELTSYSVPSSQSRANGYFWGDVVKATPTAAQWWTVSPTSANVTVKDRIDTSVSTSPATYYVRDLFIASRLPRDVHIQGYKNVDDTSRYATIKATYTNTSGTSVTTYTNTSDGLNLTAWAGARISTSASKWWDEGVLYGPNYQEYGNSYTFTESADYLWVGAIYVPATRELTVYKVDPMSQLSAITATYTKVTNPHTTDAATQATTIAVGTSTYSSNYTNLYKNSAVQLSATVNSANTSYIDLTVTSENAGATTNNCVFTVTAAAKTRTLRYVQAGDTAAFNCRTFVFSSPTNGAIKTEHPTSSTDYTVWQGEDMWAGPVYSFVANQYYEITPTTSGTAKGSGTAIVTATGAAKTRTLNIGAFAYGMSKFSWSASVGSSSIGGSTTVSTGTSATLYQPYTYNYSITAITTSDYFNFTMTPTKNDKGDSNIQVTFSSSGKTRNYNLYWDDKITAIKGSYINGSFNTTNYTPSIPGSGVKQYTDVWRGAGITVNATATSYYTPTYAKTDMDASTNAAYCTITAAATPRNIRVAFAGSYTVAIASITVNFASVGATGTAKNYHPTSSTNFTEVWAGSDVTTTVQPNQYFNVDVDKPTITKDSAAGNATVNVSGSYAYRSWTIATKSGYQNINTHSFSYINTLNPDVVTTATNYTTYTRVWQGGKCTISATAASYWMPVVWEGLTSHSNGSDTYTYEFAAGTNDIVSSLGSARRPRNLKVYLHETDARVSRALSAVTVTYQDTSASMQTVNPTTSTTYVAWSGYAITASAAAKDYASVTVSSTDWAAGYTDAIVDVTCTLASRQASVTIAQNEDSCLSTMTLNYVKYDTGTATGANASLGGTWYNVWQGNTASLVASVINSYYTYSITSYYSEPSTNNALFYVYGTAKTRYVSGTFTSIAKVSATSTEHNVDITGSGYYLKQPYTYDLTATAAQYWKNAYVLPTKIAAGSSNVALTLSAERATRNLFVDVYNRDRGAGTVTATYGGTSSTVSTSVSISGTTTNTNSGLLSAWQGEAVNYTYSVTDTTNYTIVVSSSGTAIGTTAAYITANIYGKTVNHTLSVWPSTLGTWYASSGVTTNSMSVSRNSPMTYNSWSGTVRTASVSAKSLALSIAPYIQCTTNYVVMSLSTKPTLGPSTATTFTAYIGKPVTLTFSRTERVQYGFSTGYTSYTYYPTSGTASQSKTASIPLTNGSSGVSVNGAQTTQFKFTRKSSYWTMIINGTTRSNQTYTYSSTYSTNTTVSMDAYRNSTSGMKYEDGWHTSEVSFDASADEATWDGYIYNDTNTSLSFTYTGYVDDESGVRTSYGPETVTIGARSSYNLTYYLDTRDGTNIETAYFKIYPTSYSSAYAEWWW